VRQSCIHLKYGSTIIYDRYQAKEIAMLPFGIQPWHIIVIILVAFLIFGANKLPEAGRSLGKTLSEFRKGTKEAAEGFKEELQKPGEPPVAPTVPFQSAAPYPTSPAAQPGGNFCIQCGTPNLPEARFCANCGAKMPEKVV
jgi:sec-independent protein translocase protein TatA